METTGSYKKYRETLRSLDMPCVPYMSVHLFANKNQINQINQFNFNKSKSIKINQINSRF